MISWYCNETTWMTALSYSALTVSNSSVMTPRLSLSFCFSVAAASLTSRFVVVSQAFYLLLKLSPAGCAASRFSFSRRCLSRYLFSRGSASLFFGFSEILFARNRCANAIHERGSRMNPATSGTVQYILVRFPVSGY